MNNIPRIINWWELNLGKIVILDIMKVNNELISFILECSLNNKEEAFSRAIYFAGGSLCIDLSDDGGVIVINPKTETFRYTRTRFLNLLSIKNMKLYRDVYLKVKRDTIYLEEVIQSTILKYL